jgi:hypothetical protein
MSLEDALLVLHPTTASSLARATDVDGAVAVSIHISAYADFFNAARGLNDSQSIVGTLRTMIESVWYHRTYYDFYSSRCPTQRSGVAKTS